MKKIIKKLLQKIPAFIITIGAIYLYLAASSDQYGVLYGHGSPEWTTRAGFNSLLIIGVGIFAARIQKAKKRALKKRATITKRFTVSDHITPKENRSV